MLTMTPDEFDRLMQQVDAGLAREGVPAVTRSIPVWFRITGEKVCTGRAQPDPQKGPYEGSNLHLSIGEWYKRYYPTHSVIKGDWRPRVTMIRGEVYRVQIPLVFNATKLPPVQEHIDGMSARLFETLSSEERDWIEQEFRIFYWQASDLALCLTVFAPTRDDDLVGGLLHAGWADLRGPCASFRGLLQKSWQP